MTYQLKGGEEWQDGVLHGWTGRKCEACKGHGERYNQMCDSDARCMNCGGTGDEWGVMPVQPAEEIEQR